MNSGVTVRSIAGTSPFYRAGLRKGDVITVINDEMVVNELDFHFLIADEHLSLSIRRQHSELHLSIERSEGDFSGVTLVEQPIRRCANRCIFCFIDQMPPGLRRSLYIKDEDVRLSVFSGNYVTLSNFSNRDLDHLGRIGLSPLYISVHATDPKIRNRMLGNRKSPPVVQQLSRLADHGISFHTQIVVCPGWNDGKVLTATVRDLLKFGDAVNSVAVVPVGLTRFRTKPLAPVDGSAARTICRTIGRISDREAVRDGERTVFLADELFLKAGLPIPDTSYYEAYPQIENGVGLIRQLLDDWNSALSGDGRPRRQRRAKRQSGRALLITSVSASPFLQTIVDECHEKCSGVPIEVVPVVNLFFGTTVTVAGLLTARDILREVRRRKRTDAVSEVLVPSVIFNYAGYTLDGYSASRIEKSAGAPVRVVDRIEELMNL